MREGHAYSQVAGRVFVYELNHDLDPKITEFDRPFLPVLRWSSFMAVGTKVDNTDGWKCLTFRERAEDRLKALMYVIHFDFFQ
jgi:hypothetical protein